eukprot:158304-Pyramimonas_sp.AAC.1
MALPGGGGRETPGAERSAVERSGRPSVQRDDSMVSRAHGEARMHDTVTLRNSEASLATGGDRSSDSS